jgi:VWFA-related protein
MIRPTGKARRWMAVAGVAAAGLIATSLAPSPAAQDQRPPVFRGVANFVYVDVYPRRDGHLVEGLRAEDFQVLEDGKPQKIDTFEFIRIQPNAPDNERRDPNTKEEGDQLAADPRNRVFVVYLDLYHTTFYGGHETQTPLLDFLNRTIGANDLFAVLTPEVPVSQLTFARSTATLESELTKNFDWTLGDKPISPVGRPQIETDLENCSRGDAPGLGDVLVRLNREDMLATSLADLMVRLRDLRDERKNVLLISEGWVAQKPGDSLGSLNNPGKGSIPGIGPGPTGRLGIGVPKPGDPASNQSWCDLQINRLRNIDFDQRFRDLLTLANRANVSFYPVDVGGLKLNQPIADARSRGAADNAVPPAALQTFGALNAGRARVDTLRTLAENTDGYAVVDTNGISNGFRRIADDLSAYYLLGYSSTNTVADGKFHRIDVKVAQSRVSVAARPGYLAPTADVRAAPAPAAPATPAGVTEELGRLARLQSDTELFTYGVASSSGLDVVAEIASHEIESGHFRNGADVRATLARSSGDPEVVTGKIDAGTRGALLHLPLDGNGPWRVALHVSGGDDTADDRVEIPIGSPSLLGAPLCFRGTASARLALRPVADFQFRRIERVHVEWPITAALDQRVARVLDRRGQPMALAATATEQENGGRHVVAVDVNLAPLSEGDYLIELVAGRGADTDRRLVAFRIVR